MSELSDKLISLYQWLGGGVLLGFVLGKTLPNFVSGYLGIYLFWFGVPISIIAFVRRANLSGSVWMAPVTAWIGILLGAGMAWLWIWLWQRYRRRQELPPWESPTQGSFLLASMVGNTGYLGYPVNLTLVGSDYFAWALFYDFFGSMLGASLVGVALAAKFGSNKSVSWDVLWAIAKNPIFWSIAFGLAFKQVTLPPNMEKGLQGLAWISLGLAIVLIGMRLSQLSSWKNLPRASVSLGIKMLVVPFIAGVVLSALGITGPPRLAMVLQMAMPPAFVTLVIAEAYDLDRQLSVTALAAGSIGLLLTLPLWVWLYG
jgi:hypothetical protein